MKLNVKKFNELTLEELYSILALRAEVFVVEQECPYQDLDGNDRRAVHVFTTEGSQVLACLRVFMKDDGDATIGRVVTSKKLRGTGAGKELMLKGISTARALFPGKRCVIHAQSYAVGFYEKCGFHITSGSEPFLEDNIPHREMELFL